MLKSPLPAASSSNPVEACACTIMRSFAFSVTTLAMAAPAELLIEPAGVVTMLTLWAEAVAISNGAATTAAIILSIGASSRGEAALYLFDACPFGEPASTFPGHACVWIMIQSAQQAIQATTPHAPAVRANDRDGDDDRGEGRPRRRTRRHQDRAAHLPARRRRAVSGAVRGVAVSLRQQRVAGLSAVPVARDRADPLVHRAGLRLRAHGRARLGLLRGRLRLHEFAGAARPLRHHRVDRAATVV